LAEFSLLTPTQRRQASDLAGRVEELLDQARYVCGLRSGELRDCYMGLRQLFELKKDRPSKSAVEESLDREFPGAVAELRKFDRMDSSIGTDAQQPRRASSKRLVLGGPSMFSERHNSPRL
jgi:hypothetical protein